MICHVFNLYLYLDKLFSRVENNDVRKKLRKSTTL